MNNPANSLIIAILAFVGVCVATCSNSMQSGTISEVDNKVLGKVEYSNGEPANNTLLRMRRPDYLPPSNNNSATIECDSCFTASTDENGEFRFYSVPADTYIIVGNHHDSLFVLISPVIIPGDDSTISLPPATLRPAGAIQGTIHFAKGGDYTQIFALVFGLGRFVEVNREGDFFLDKLPAGTYRLRFMDRTDGTNSFDTAGIEVRMGDTTILDVTAMHSTLLPRPLNFMCGYDSLAQIVSLTWNKSVTNNNLSYRIYRSIDYANYKLLTDPAISDTFFRDDVVYFANPTVLYAVSAVDSTEKESNLSENRIVDVTSQWNVDTVRLDFPASDTSAILKCYPGKNGDWWIFRKAALNDSTQPEVAHYDSSGKYLTSWKPFQKNGLSVKHYTDLGRLAFDDNGNIYLLGGNICGYNYRLCKFDSSFSLVDTIIVPGDDSYYPVVFFDIYDNNLYVVNNKWSTNIDTLALYDTSLRLQKKFEYDDFVTETNNINVFNDTIAVGIVNDSLKIVYLDNRMNEIGGFDVTSLVDSIESQITPKFLPPYYRGVTPLKNGFCVTAFINARNLLFYFDRQRRTCHRYLIGDYFQMRFLKNGSFITDDLRNGEIYRYSIIIK